jgi:hypothetical protein
MERAKAFETDDYALRCYIDQLPVDRCLFCAQPTAPRQIHVSGPLHQWTNLNELADSDSVADRLAVAGKLLNRGVGVSGRSQQTVGKVWLAVCWQCAPSPKVPSIVFAVLAVATAGLFALGQILPAIGALIATLVFAVVAWKRTTLSMGEIDEDDFMFKIHKVEDGVKAEVLALGAARHPANQTQRAQLTA